MQAVYIPHLLKAPKRSLEIIVDGAICGLETLIPVKGGLTIRHGGNFLEVTSQAETIITLVCDRCLQHYNHRLEIDTSEMIWLESELENVADLPTEREVSLEDLSEVLAPDGHFDPETWLFEQLSLALPLRKICGENCPGADRTSRTSLKQETYLDARWSALAALKEHLNNSLE